MIVNDFSIQVASANGTGSQSSNLAILRGVFNMGVPVVAKNFFPSNIQGLPTWYFLRITKDNFQARAENTHILVCMNEDTVEDDLRKVDAGAVCFVRDKLVHTCDRKDITVVDMPVDDIVKACCEPVKMRKLVMNFVYVGVLMEYLAMDREAVRKGLDKVFGGKAKAVEINMAAVDAGAKWAKENLKIEKKFKIEKMDKTGDLFIIEGNEASALGAMFAGCSFIAWYPITPSSSLCEYAIQHFEHYRKDAQGKKTYAILQAEDEIGSLGMVMGASWAGARSMTSTSGPGISLMGEFTGLGYFTETPAVIVDVQRMGPSTGLPTRTSQGDVGKAYRASHGDCKHPMLFPAEPREAFSCMIEAFDLADRLQTPVFVMSDLDLGMNPWMTRDFDYPAKPIDRGKVLDDAALKKVEKFLRYGDPDGDGVPPRTVPGTLDPKGAWFARGSGHTPQATYSEDPENYKRLLDRLSRKFETARGLVPQPVIKNVPDAKIGIIAFGSSTQGIDEAITLAGRKGIKVDFMRIRALPFVTKTLRDFVTRFESVYVVEQNRDAQMLEILRSEVPDLAGKLKSVLNYDGMPLTAVRVMRGIPALAKVEG